MNNLSDCLEEILEGIDLCNKAHLNNSTLILIYSGIDAVASIERIPGEGTKASFLRWVNTYLLSSKPLVCDAMELYGARCGLVHSMSADSDLSKAGSARPVVYSFGGASPTISQEASDALGLGYVALDLNDLIEAFRLGVHAYRLAVQASPERQAAVNQAITNWLGSWSPNDFDAMIQQRKLDHQPNL
jgi:hypothetical protein